MAIQEALFSVLTSLPLRTQRTQGIAEGVNRINELSITVPHSQFGFLTSYIVHRTPYITMVFHFVFHISYFVFSLWHYILSAFEKLFMDKNKEKAEQLDDQQGKGRTSNSEPGKQKQEASSDISKVDQQEGEMNHGELGGNLNKEDQNT
jgi:hypothetical protein